jgi:hypothetical protein
MDTVLLLFSLACNLRYCIALRRKSLGRRCTVTAIALLDSYRRQRDSRAHRLEEKSEGTGRVVSCNIHGYAPCMVDIRR